MLQVFRFFPPIFARSIAGGIYGRAKIGGKNGKDAAKLYERNPKFRLREVFTYFEGEIIEKQKIKNLMQAEEYLKTLSLNPSILELIPNKLYCQCLQQGDGAFIQSEDLLLARYSAAVLESGEEQIVFTPRNSPTVISVGDTIPGFVQGVSGIRIGERRKLFIHPDLAYGSFGGKIDPNQLLIIDIEAIGVQTQSRLLDSE